MIPSEKPIKIQSTTTDLDIIESELQARTLFLNTISGVLAFSFSLACLSLQPYLAFIATIASFVMIVAVSETGAPRFSPKLIAIRSKRNPTHRELEILEFSRKTFLSNFRHMPFAIGTASLGVVGIYNSLLIFLEFITTF